jgi:hypothetical protein
MPWPARMNYRHPQPWFGESRLVAPIAQGSWHQSGLLRRLGTNLWSPTCGAGIRDTSTVDVVPSIVSRLHLTRSGSAIRLTQANHCPPSIDHNRQLRITGTCVSSHRHPRSISRVKPAPHLPRTQSRAARVGAGGRSHRRRRPGGRGSRHGWWRCSWQG